MIYKSHLFTSHFFLLRNNFCPLHLPLFLTNFSNTPGNIINITPIIFFQINIQPPTNFEQCPLESATSQLQPFSEVLHRPTTCIQPYPIRRNKFARPPSDGATPLRRLNNSFPLCSSIPLARGGASNPLHYHQACQNPKRGEEGIWRKWKLSERFTIIKLWLRTVSRGLLHYFWHDDVSSRAF